jgi:hypothetical protein
MLIQLLYFWISIALMCVLNKSRENSVSLPGIELQPFPSQSDYYTDY